MSSPWVYKARIIRWVDGDSVYVELIREVKRELKEDFGFGFSVLITIREERGFVVDKPIRLYGIDTPETHGRKAKDPAELAAGKAAEARCNELLPPGSICEVRSHKLKAGDPRKGKYGRYLLELFKLQPHGVPEEVSVNQTLVNEGHAVEYYGGKKG